MQQQFVVWDSFCEVYKPLSYLFTFGGGCGGSGGVGGGCVCDGGNGGAGGGNCGVLRDVVNQGVLYFLNIMQFYLLLHVSVKLQHLLCWLSQTP